MCIYTYMYIYIYTCIYKHVHIHIYLNSYMFIQQFQCLTRTYVPSLQLCYDSQ